MFHVSVGLVSEFLLLRQSLSAVQEGHARHVDNCCSVVSLEVKEHKPFSLVPLFVLQTTFWVDCVYVLSLASIHFHIKCLLGFGENRILTAFEPPL